MPYLEYSEIKRVMIELSNHCNAACPQCDRNVMGAGVNPRLNLSHLSLAEIRDIFPPSFCQQLREVVLSGVHGDPMIAPDAAEVLHYLRDSGAQGIVAHTNGSMRAPEWWADLGAVLNRPFDNITFSLDGIGDTHTTYRRGTSWTKIIENMRAFIDAGGHASWNFLIFKHNQHQVERARELAKEFGCKVFRVRMTSRFHSIGMRNEATPAPVLRRNPGRPVDMDFTREIFEKLGAEYTPDTNFSALLKDQGYEYQIEETTRAEYKNPSTASDLQKIIVDHGSADEFFDRAIVECQEREMQRIYIDANARLWPCLFIGGDTKSWHFRHRFREDIEEKLIAKYGGEFNSLRKRSLVENLNHPWLRDELVASWGRSIHDRDNPRLKRCSRTCGKGFKPNLTENAESNL